MKIKILNVTYKSYWYSENIGEEFDVSYFGGNRRETYHRGGNRCIVNNDAVITELPKSFCVKRCDDGIKWGKYIDWLNKTYNTDFCGRLFNFDNPSDYPYYGVINNEGQGIKIPFGTEIHIDDMIKHIEYMERHIKGGEEFHKESQLTVKMDKEFDLTTNEGRLAYARKHYPIGTKYKPLSDTGLPFYHPYDGIEISEYKPRIWVSRRGVNNGIEVGRVGLIYHQGTNRWAEIIKEETNMNTQKLSRQGLKEIHSIACSTWKITLEGWGSRNPLEDYIELSQKEIDLMFNASDNNQKSILSKYLKQDDDSVDVTKFNVSGRGFCDDNFYIIRDREWGEYKKQSFLLSERYDWEIKTDGLGQLCLIPTKKK